MISYRFRSRFQHLFIKRHYQGSGEYYVHLDRGTADNTDMNANLKVRDGKILDCADCDEPVAQWIPGDLGRVLSRRAGGEGRWVNGSLQAPSGICSTGLAR